MNDITLYSTAEAKKRGLNRRFIVAGLTSILLIVTALTAGGYFRLQESALRDMLRHVSSELQQYSESKAFLAALKAPAADPVTETQVRQGANSSSVKVNKGKLSQQTRLAATLLGTRAMKISSVNSVAVHNADIVGLWQSNESFRISSEQRPSAIKLVQSAGKPYVSLQHDLFGATAWLEALTNEYPVSEVLVAIQLPNNNKSVIKLAVDMRGELSLARGLAGQLLLILTISTVLLFLLLFYIFRRGIHTINEQEERLNDQIARLSKLLTANKDMQRSMKTASARAVELNEQFLRRVGADLHDGPAQMIGFAVLRLAQVNKQEVAKQFGHEFHAVRQALDESLEEIRGISSGLVLPELEHMSLEECLRKVVVLHGSKSDAEVAQYYQDLPNNIPLPIKITAYRFTQEGLNNAHRHGKATKCRLNAFVKGDVLHLSLKDNGTGFRKSTLSPSGGHLGLMGLKDRVESLGGRFSINSELGVGTALKLSISLRDDN